MKYLFAHFTGESKTGEQIYFALSEDGLHWHDMNGGNPVLCSGIGEMGVRDPFVFRSVIDGNFYIIATDLRIANGKGWDAAVRRGSTKMVIWKSEDLIHWSEPWMHEVGIEGAGCVWAPEAIYDPKREAYLVFWASWVKEEGEETGKHRIFCSYTKDFVNFTRPEKYIERVYDVIDTTIVEEDGVFYRFSKDEITKKIRMDCGTDLQGEFAEVASETLDLLEGVEGPAAFPMPEEHLWCLLVDRFAAGLGYLPLICRDLRGGDFTVLDESKYSMDQNQKRHGSVLVLTDQEYQTLLRGE